eukprot:4693040-Amphidinium_carterae.1
MSLQQLQQISWRQRSERSPRALTMNQNGCRDQGRTSKAEKRLAGVFASARQCAPSIVVLEDLQSRSLSRHFLDWESSSPVAAVPCFFGYKVQEDVSTIAGQLEDDD